MVENERRDAVDEGDSHSRFILRERVVVAVHWLSGRNTVVGAPARLGGDDRGGASVPPRTDQQCGALPVAVAGAAVARRSFDLGSVADGVFRLDDGAVASVGDFTAAVRTGCGNDVRGGRAMESGEPAGVRDGGGRRRAAAVAAGEESERRGGGEVRRRRQSCRCRWEERKRDEGRVGSRDCGGATMGDGCGWVWKTVGVSEGSKRKVACVRMT